MFAALDIFICYAGPDRQLATALAAACRSEELTVFIDADLTPGDQWDDEIRSALERADVVTVIVTGRWKLPKWPTAAGDSRSWYGPEEVVRAIDRRRRHGDVRIVPILTESDLEDAVPLGLGRTVALPLGSDGWRGVARRLKAVCDGLPAPPAKAEPDQIDLDRARDLIEALADHFPDVSAARALWTRAGGKGRSVQNLSRPVDLWQALWLRSRGGAAARPEALLQATLAELPENPTFLRYLDALSREN